MVSDKYATFDDDGVLQHRLDSSVNKIPKGAIKVSEQIFERLIVENDGVWRIVDGEIVKEPLPEVVPSQENINAEARAYLANTDWYVTRMHETGQPVPDDIATARQAARNRVIE